MISVFNIIQTKCSNEYDSKQNSDRIFLLFKVDAMLAGNDEFSTRLTKLQMLRRKLHDQQKISSKLENDLKKAVNFQTTARKLLDSVELQIRQQVSLFDFVVQSTALSLTFFYFLLQFDDVSKWHKEILSGNVTSDKTTTLSNINDESNANIGLVEEDDDDVILIEDENTNNILIDDEIHERPEPSNKARNEQSNGMENSSQEVKKQFSSIRSAFK